MKDEQANTNMFCLNPRYSTTRMVTKDRPTIENDPSSEVHKKLFLPSHPQRQGEGGLRTKGYFKRSLPGRPLVSIITVSLNSETKNIEETIKSVISQTYENIEYIIIDGGSTDGTLDVIRKYEDKIDYWVSETDSGIYYGMNKGIGLYNGDYIYFLNTGDYLFSKSIIEEVVNESISYNQPDLIWGNVITQNGVKYFGTFGSKKDFLTKTISHQAVFSHRRIIEPFDIKYKISADYDSLLKVFSRDTTSIYLNNTVAFYDVIKSDKNKKQRLLYNHKRCVEKKLIVKEHYSGLYRILSFLYFTFNSYRWKFMFWISK